MRHCVNLVELNRDHLGKECFIRVVDHTTSLDDVHRGIFHEPLSGPTRIVRMREMIAVEDCNDIGTCVELEEVVEIVGLRFGAWDVGDSKLWVLLLHFCQLGLERFNWLWCIVHCMQTVSLYFRRLNREFLPRLTLSLLRG